MYVFEFAGRALRFDTRPGVFSSDGADAGSTLLLSTVLPSIRPHQRVLDLGCGAGLIGLSVATLLTRGEAYLVDVDVRATRLAQANAEENGITNATVVLGDGVRDLPPKLRFDVVVSNPPTHDGKEVLRELTAGTYQALKPGGRCWVVVNRLLSIRDMIHESFGNVEIVARQGGFIVLSAEKVRR